MRLVRRVLRELGDGWNGERGAGGGWELGGRGGERVGGKGGLRAGGRGGGGRDLRMSTWTKIYRRTCTIDSEKFYYFTFGSALPWGSVSFTHLTLPRIPLFEVPGVAGLIKKKIQQMILQSEQHVHTP